MISPSILGKHVVEFNLEVSLTKSLMVEITKGEILSLFTWSEGLLNLKTCIYEPQNAILLI